MADEGASGKSSDEKPTNWVELVHDGGKKAVAGLLTAGGLAGFATLAGGAVIWARLKTVGVPPEQAIAAVPDRELVTVGASFLLLAAFFGALAVVGVYVIDRGGRATVGMSRGLLVLLAVEGVLLILLLTGTESREIAAAELFALFTALALAATFPSRLAYTVEDLDGRRGEKDPTTRGGLRRRTIITCRSWLEGYVQLTGRQWWFIASAVALIAVGITLSLEAWDWFGWTAIMWVLAAALAFLAQIAFIAWVRHEPPDDCESGSCDQEPEDRPKENDREAASASPAPGATPAAPPLVAVIMWLGSALSRQRIEIEKITVDTGASAAGGAGAKDCDGKPAKKRTRPRRLELTACGRGLLVGAVFLAVVGPTLVLMSPLSGVLLLAAVTLTGGLRRIAYLSRAQFVWYGLAVFVSVPLLGTVAAIAQNLADPQVQPVAIIRKADGPSEAIQGLYVTETDKRVYFANIATEGCTARIEENSGRLLWVRSDEVVAMSIGPQQDVTSARDSALEMTYALTPAVETPAGRSFKLTKAERRFQTAEEAPLHEADGQRLEDPGPAVRPDFGRGLTLEPELAAPGKVVTLRMSAPNRDIGDGEVGFGDQPEGHALRLNGVPLPLVKEPTDLVDKVEFVKTTEGTVVTLDKKGLYWRDAPGTEPVLFEDDQLKGEGSYYLKLESGPKPVVTSGEPSGFPKYFGVEVEATKTGVRISRLTDEETMVKVDGRAGAVQLAKKRTFLRQAWGEDEIRFKVPDDASSGVVTVECKQIAGQPLLRVVRAPKARLSVRMAAGSQKIVLDSSRSRDVDGKKGEDGKDADGLTRSWTIAGRRMGNRKKVSVYLPQRPDPYSAKLTVTDEDGQSDSVLVRLFRLPRSYFDFDKDELGDGPAEKLDEVKEKVLAAVKKKPPVAIALHGHTDAVGADEYNADLSQRRVDFLRTRVFRPRNQKKNGKKKQENLFLTPIVVRAFGESCPVDHGGGRSKRNRRVEIFLLDQGARVITQESCKARYVRRTSW